MDPSASHVSSGGGGRADGRVPRAFVSADADPDDPLDCVLTLGIALPRTGDDAGAVMTVGQRVLLAVVWILSSQANSGLSMTIEDSPLPASELASALRIVDAPQQAALIEEAALIDGDWAQLDERWWGLDPGDARTSAAMWRYVQEHPQDFLTD